MTLCLCLVVKKNDFQMNSKSDPSETAALSEGTFSKVIPKVDCFGNGFGSKRECFVRSCVACVFQALSLKVRMSDSMFVFGC